MHQEEMPPFRGYRGAERYGGPDEGRRQWEYNRGYGSRDVYNQPSAGEFRGRYGAMQRGYPGEAPRYADDYGRNAPAEYGYDYGSEGRGPGAAQQPWQSEERESDYNARWDRRRVDAYGLAYPGSSYANREAAPGPHVGRGPRGYRRSDERIREEVSDRLTEHSWLDASELEVRVEQGVVTLTGFVDSRQQKRLAEDIAESVSGVQDVRNELCVHDHAAGAESTGAAAGTRTSAQPASNAASQPAEREPQRAGTPNNRQTTV
jgi:osmotically-inducible protein OsmY